jgi:hypothetical protein
MISAVIGDFSSLSRVRSRRPRDSFLLDLLCRVRFAQVEVLHKNVCFAAFGTVKG